MTRARTTDEDPATRKGHIDAADKLLPDVAARLSCMLFGSYLRPEMQHLAIVADGDLVRLPFAALPEHGCKDPGAPLVSAHRVSLMPSLSVSLTNHGMINPEPFRRDVAIFANPVFDPDDPRVHHAEDRSHSEKIAFRPSLLPLDGTSQEADAIAKLAGRGRVVLFLGFDANLQTFLGSALKDYRIVHLATHGIFDENAPRFSGLVLSLVNQDGLPVSGYLTAHDVSRLDLNSDLVVLSSCSSDAGDFFSGEGKTGLSYSFLAAGAKRVISTSWIVDDDISKTFMISLYREILREGVSAPEAMRRSQVKMMSDSRTKAPYYWAAYNLTSVIP